MAEFGAAARTHLASARLETKKVLQPDLVNAEATMSMPQPYASARITAAHSATVRRASALQFSAIADKLIFRTPPDSASGGPPILVRSTSTLFLTTSRPPRFILVPIT